jgi:hypothetical protein
MRPEAMLHERARWIVAFLNGVEALMSTKSRGAPRLTRAVSFEPMLSSSDSSGMRPHGLGVAQLVILPAD